MISKVEDKLVYKKLLNIALALSFITIFYNIVEGLISTFFGLEDDTLALFGFGVDSFVEVVSGVGIAHMIVRMKKNESANKIDGFEKTALTITGTAFYILAFGLVAAAIFIIILGRNPETTIVGIIISIISIFTMYFLYKYKLKIGKKLDSKPIISDAHCTKTCFYLSFVLLASSTLYLLFKISYVDALGSMGIAWYAYKEGKEAFEKAKTGSSVCSDSSCSH